MADQPEHPRSSPPPSHQHGLASRLATLRRSADRRREDALRRFAQVQDRRGIREPVLALRFEQRTGATLLAGGLAYRLFLWLLPFGLVIAAVASFWVRSNAKSLQDAARSLGLGGVAAHSAIIAVEQGSRPRWYLLLTGLVLMVWAGVAAVRALRVTARLAWGLPTSRLHRPLLASAAFTVIATTGLAGSVVASWVQHVSPVWGLVATAGDLVLYSGLALWALSHLPRPPDATWHSLWPGALLIGAGLGAMQIFLAYVLAGQLERAPSLYGALGASSVVLLALFVIARLLVSAMFLNAAIARAGEHEPTPRG
jgi:uncharacterized BrkB/YihY/UPF0761 family membrane protein